MTLHRLGLLGDPVAHSRSPAMMRAALEASGIEGTYEALRVAPRDLGGTLRRLWDEGWTGLNVTVPHKVEAMKHVALAEPSAEEVGAVNTLARGEGCWVGSNTDVVAAEGVLRGAGVTKSDLYATVLGTGGAARACVAALRRRGVSSITVVGRTSMRACGEWTFAALGSAEAEQSLARASVVVQATRCGMQGGEDSVELLRGAPLRVCSRGTVAFDVVYDPEVTQWMTEAGNAGLRVIVGGGLAMLGLQGAAAFERWFAVPAPIEAMREALAPNGVFSTGTASCR